MTLEEMLADAQAQYHKLMTGQNAVEFRDQNGELVRYQAASAGRLAAYIEGLKQQLGLVKPSAPMGVFF